MILADQAEKAIWQIREDVRKFLSDTMAPEKADELARLMSEGTWTHDHPISFEEAGHLGLPVMSDMPKEVLELMELFPQPVRQQPAVEYLPAPRKFDHPR